MISTSEFSKLAELRAKTDRELIRLVANALELGIQCASASNSPSGPLRDKAEEIYMDTFALLSKVENLNERRRLELKQKGLRQLLDHSAIRQMAPCSAY